ncbi:MAG: hypothetical protein GWN01_01875 [Nitrosopumilaceae archaeon]|nr:hypothetical protein [Nitrosopumilaceae archaeon]NIT99721.1 hypothetical protein [Nitrosopumilaceae archaeon]NIU88582.1 hypothetical protein [Nitrosopumilaceae archaeon]NIV64856.1 hypothetical protein [Nitrosopumilaceae archaeon]NIX60324.1 hypothetical protein [Nitrosopumilaceae archaeon]
MKFPFLHFLFINQSKKKEFRKFYTFAKARPFFPDSSCFSQIENFLNCELGVNEKKYHQLFYFCWNEFVQSGIAKVIVRGRRKK